MALNFTFSGQLGSLLTSKYAFRWSWIFQKLMQVRYTSDFRTFPYVKIFFPRSRGSWNCKKCPCGMFFSILMLNISATKELLHKPSQIHWNTTGPLSGKLKRKIWVGALSYKILLPEITKSWEIAIFRWERGGTLAAWEPKWNSMLFHDFVNFWKFQSQSFG